MFAGQPQPVEIHHRGIWYSGELIGWRHESDGRVAARVRCRVDGLRHSTWKDLADLRLPDPKHPPRAEPFPAVGAPAGPGRPEDEDDATRPHALLAAMRGSRPAQARPRRDAARGRAGTRAVAGRPPRRSPNPSSSDRGTAARPSLGLPQRRLTGPVSRPTAAGRRLVDRGRGPVGPHHQAGAARAGCAASRRRRRPCAYAAVASMSAQVRSSATTVTEATPVGGRAGAGVDEVRAAVGGAGGGDRAACGPARRRPAGAGRAGPRCRSATAGASGSSGAADHVAAGGQAEVGVGQARAARAAARSTAQPFTTPLGSRTVAPSGPGRRTSNAPPDSRSACSPRASTSATSGGQSASVELAAAEPGDDGVARGRC